MNKATPKTLELAGFEGIDNSTSDLNRPVNTWEKLENFDLYLPGAIRKTKGPLAYPNDSTSYPDLILLILNYKRRPEDTMRLLGIGWTGKVWDLETGALVFQLPITLPTEAWYVIQQAESFNYADLLGDRIVINWLILGDSEGYIWAWDGVLTVFRIGKDLATATTAPYPPAYIFYACFTNDENRGQGIVVHRKYAVTLYNPFTKHETSPSLDIDERNTTANEHFTNVIGPSTMQTPPSYPFLSWIGLQVRLTRDILAGYTQFKVYATRDGGSELFLCTNTAIYDDDTGIWTASADDGALDIPADGVALVLDGISDPGNIDDTKQVHYVASLSGEPPIVGAIAIDSPQDPGHGNIPESFLTPDSILVTPGPDYGANDPPPLAHWGVGYRGRLWLVNSDSRAKLSFSKPGEFWSFPADNYIVVEGDVYDDITALKAQQDELLIAKERSMYRLLGVDFTDFTIIPVQKATGMLTKRGILELPEGLISLSLPGLVIWSGDVIKFIGLEIVEVTNTIDTSYPIAIFTVYDSKQQMGLFFYPGIGTLADGSFKFRGEAILIQPGREHPYSIYTGIPNGYMTVCGAMVEDSQHVKRILVAGALLFGGGTTIYEIFAEDSDLEAIAETQWLPVESLPSRKLFKYLRVEGDIADWVLEYRTDKFDWQPVSYSLLYKNPLGVIGNRLKLRLTNTSQAGAELSNMKVDFIDLGERR